MEKHKKIPRRANSKLTSIKRILRLFIMIPETPKQNKKEPKEQSSNKVKGKV